MAKHNINEWQSGLSAEERTANAKRGAAANAAARAQHRLFKDILKEVLACPVSDENELKAQLEALGLKANYENAMMLATAHKATAGDVEAVRFVRDTVGEKPTEAFNLAVQNRPIKSLDLAGMTDQELQALADKADSGD